MTIAQAIIFFCITWWLLLLIALPFGSRSSQNHVKGQAISAPERTFLRKKMKFSTLLCLLITLSAYSFANAQTRHETSSGCNQPTLHEPRADIQAKDGMNQHGSAMKPATLDNPHPVVNQLEFIDIPMELPLDDYTKTAGRNADLSQTRIRPGTITVDTLKGEARFNGVNLSQPPLYNNDCLRNKESIYSTK